jgi:hypothetical protein
VPSSNSWKSRIGKPLPDFAAEKGYFWNASIFLFGRRSVARRTAPLRAQHGPRKLGRSGFSCLGSEFYLDRRELLNCRRDSIDYAVMEKTAKAALVPLNAGWSDVGTWDALFASAEKDERDNAARGDPGGVLIVDETGFVKKGAHSVGVARQYSRTAGRIENAQVSVFLAYASCFGQALIDRRPYLPEAWAKDEARRSKAQVPDGVAFATKPQMALELIASALNAQVPCAFVLADALCGSDSRLRRMLEERGQAYVLAAPKSRPRSTASPIAKSELRRALTPGLTDALLDQKGADPVDGCGPS